MHVRGDRQRRWRILALAGVLIIGCFCGCAGVAGLPRMGEIDLGKTYPSVQVFPNYEHFPECNFDVCAVLFSAPTEYTTPSGGIRIQFGFMPGEGIPRGPSLGTDFF